jgi:hypothetical protein
MAHGQNDYLFFVVGTYDDPFESYRSNPIFRWQLQINAPIVPTVAASTFWPFVQLAAAR